MAVSEGPTKIDHGAGLKWAFGTVTTETDGTATITCPFAKILGAHCTIEDAALAATDLCTTISSVGSTATTVGHVNFAILDSTDATAGSEALTLHYIILGY